MCFYFAFVCHSPSSPSSPSTLLTTLTHYHLSFQFGNHIKMRCEMHLSFRIPAQTEICSANSECDKMARNNKAEIAMQKQTTFYWLL